MVTTVVCLVRTTYGTWTFPDVETNVVSHAGISLLWLEELFTTFLLRLQQSAESKTEESLSYPPHICHIQYHPDYPEFPNHMQIRSNWERIQKKISSDLVSKRLAQVHRAFTAWPLQESQRVPDTTDRHQSPESGDTSCWVELQFPTLGQATPNPPAQSRTSTWCSWPWKWITMECPGSGSLRVLSSLITITHQLPPSLGQNCPELYNLRAWRGFAGHYILYPFFLPVRKKEPVRLHDLPRSHY